MDSDSLDSPRLPRRSESDEEVCYATVSSAPPKRRAGRTKFRETRHPVFKGVRRRNGDKWVCEVREPNKKSRIWLGTFATAEMAARAHDVAAIALRGRTACLNFADSAWLLPSPDSSNPNDIRKAAARAAEAFRPNSTPSTALAPAAAAADPSTSWAHAEPSSTPASDPLFDDGDFNFGMQEYLDMAEGLLIEPPPLPVPANDENYGDVSLWSYSI
ncbi:dehydration-responsive element-binding protein 1G-like [Zingiber officinale]|uniref:AP2/ERF domain-containing protein n=1 Tax=Zingiber officinale TaxID=94328 RepID=A0A8J5CDJ0_ZINOF|nr:dehydration-responsive element-binding protein 1G-like [Zingiber officinale]XP_042444616.1 dehydration-responsive element-binding protein 1G-like [Zingiber officinale]KAG6471854.1 hypothetical protein ZIOFF_069301 [Zingiber officinale]KAG6473666.1 hypothetical protein ZIOFF_067583 [Zingiber officinale]